MALKFLFWPLNKKCLSIEGRKKPFYIILEQQPLMNRGKIPNKLEINRVLLGIVNLDLYIPHNISNTVFNPPPNIPQRGSRRAQ